MKVEANGIQGMIGTRIYDSRFETKRTEKGEMVIKLNTATANQVKCTHFFLKKKKKKEQTSNIEMHTQTQKIQKKKHLLLL